MSDDKKRELKEEEIFFLPAVAFALQRIFKYFFLLFYFWWSSTHWCASHFWWFFFFFFNTFNTTSPIAIVIIQFNDDRSMMCMQLPQWDWESEYVKKKLSMMIQITFATFINRIYKIILLLPAWACLLAAFNKKWKKFCTQILISPGISYTSFFFKHDESEMLTWWLP